MFGLSLNGSKTMSKTKNTVSWKDLNLDLASNDRVHRSEQLVSGVNVDTYAIPALRDAVLVADGEIFEPVHVEDVKGKLITRRGHRRTLVAQELGKLKDAELWAAYRSAKLGSDVNANISETPDTKQLKVIRDHLENIPVVIHKSLSDADRMKLIHDKDTKGLNRVDVVKTVYKMLKDGYKEADISTKLTYQLAEYSGNVAKLNSLSDDPAKRNAEIKQWFHGLVGAYFIPTFRAGEEIRRQVLLTAMVEDGLLHREKRDKTGNVIQKASDVLPDFLLTHNRWNQLVKGFNEDKKKGIVKDETPITDSPAVKAKMKEFIDADMGIKTPRKADPRPAVTDVDTMLKGDPKSELSRSLLTFFKTGEKPDGFSDLDERIGNMQQKFEVIEANISKVRTEGKGSTHKGETIRDLLASLVNDSVADFERQLAKFCDGMEIVETPDTSDEKHAELATA